MDFFVEVLNLSFNTANYNLEVYEGNKSDFIYAKILLQYKYNKDVQKGQ
jgi:hypothetical protein